MKNIIYTFLICLFANVTVYAQSKFSFGLKGGAQYAEPKLLELRDPFPYYKYSGENRNNVAAMYGSTFAISAAVLGLYTQYSLVKSNRIRVNLEVLYNRKGYGQQDLTQNTRQSVITIKKNYLDIPLSFMVNPFKNSGFFIEPGINQAFLLSKKTQFPETNSSSSEFEKRRSRGLLRETNLTGFRVGAGWDYKLFNLAAYYQTDKQYEYVQAAIRYKLIK